VLNNRILRNAIFNGPALKLEGHRIGKQPAIVQGIARSRAAGINHRIHHDVKEPAMISARTGVEFLFD
jgi:hypothetical protein